MSKGTQGYDGESFDVAWQFGKTNMGGAAGLIYAIPMADVVSIPNGDALGFVNGNIQLKPGKKMTTVYFTQGTGGVLMNGQGDRDSGSFKNGVGWNTPGNEPENLAFAKNYNNGPAIFLVADSDDYLNIIGSLAYAAYRTTIEGGSGKAATDRRGLEYLFEADSPNPPLRYLGNLADLLVKPPIATDASAILADGFTAEWNTVDGATDYFLEVSENADFSTKVTGYDGLVVAGTSQAVTGLNGTSTYYYRVRTREGTSISGNSNVIAVTTS